MEEVEVGGLKYGRGGSGRVKVWKRWKWEG